MITLFSGWSIFFYVAAIVFVDKQIAGIKGELIMDTSWEVKRKGTERRE